MGHETGQTVTFWDIPEVSGVVTWVLIVAVLLPFIEGGDDPKAVLSPHYPEPLHHSPNLTRR